MREMLYRTCRVKWRNEETLLRDYVMNVGYQ
jgi:hypothetical protein